MEVTVEPQGIESDSIVSIRLGSVRRQGVVAQLRPFTFPTPPENTESFTVDVYRPVANSTLHLSPDILQSVRIPTTGNCTPKALNLLVKTIIAAEGTDVASKPAECGLFEYCQSPSKSSVVTAREYLEKFNLESFFRDLLRHVLKEKPDDPVAFLAEHLQALAGGAESRINAEDNDMHKTALGGNGIHHNEFHRPRTLGSLIESGVIPPTPAEEAALSLKCLNARLNVENERLAAELGRLQQFAKDNELPEQPQLEEQTTNDALACVENFIGQTRELMASHRQLRTQHESLRGRLLAVLTWVTGAVTLKAQNGGFQKDSGGGQLDAVIGNLVKSLA